MELSLYDLRAVLDETLCRLLALRVVCACKDGAAHDREGDADCLSLGKAYIERAGDTVHDHLFDAIFGKVALLHIVGRGNLDDHMSTCTLDSESDVVGKRDRKVRRDRAGKVCELCRKLKHVF